jgi:hypothetical protein
MVLVEQRRHVKAKPTVTLRQSDAKPEHALARVGALGPIEFTRCRCGFTLAKYDGSVFWIRARPGIREIRTADALTKALATRCWHARRQNKATSKTPVPVAPPHAAVDRNRPHLSRTASIAR